MPLPIAPPVVDATLSTSACIAALGGPAFYPRFVQLLGQFSHADQLMVFELDNSGEQAHVRLVRNRRDPVLAERLAHEYTDGRFERDPLLAELTAEAGSLPACGRLRSGSLPAAYRQRFFQAPQLSEKFAFVAADGARRYYVNLYRARNRPGFEDGEIVGLVQQAPLLAALLGQQLGCRAESAPLAGELSEREAQICTLICRGHTAKSIARQLALAESSVLTYRQRAYRKLGISRKSQLLTLFN